MRKIHEEPDQPTPQMPCVVYGAKSTADPRESVPRQHRQILERIEGDRERWVYAGPFADIAKSAYHGNRGDGLAQAKDAALEAAKEHGHAELWVQHTDRLARGDGVQAEHLVQWALWCRQSDVRIRSIQNDGVCDTFAMAGMVGDQAHGESHRKANGVSDGMRGAAERGDPPGGISPDGYAVRYRHDAAGRVIGREWHKDPERAEIYRLHWDLALKGYTAGEIVAELDRRGYVTKPRKSTHRPRRFDANRVGQTLNNPLYAGLRTYKSEVVGEGAWDGYVSPEDFYRLREDRARRAHVEQRKPGRPVERYLLATIATCGGCGGPMDVVTGRHERKDMTRARRYVCRTHRERPQDCRCGPFDANAVDPGFLENLDSFMGDVGRIRDTLLAARDADRERLGHEIARAEADAAECERVTKRMRARYDAAVAADDDAKAETVLEAIGDRKAEQRRAVSRLAAAQHAAMDAASENPDDEIVRFYTALYAELSGRVGEARGDVKRANAALRTFFDAVELTHTDEGTRMDPVLSAEAARRVLLDPERWPHSIAATCGDHEVIGVGEYDGQPLVFIRAPKGTDPADLMRESLEIEVHGPPAAIAPDTNSPTARTSCCATSGASRARDARERSTLTHAGCARS
jgi:hypothetical protein